LTDQADEDTLKMGNFIDDFIKSNRNEIQLSPAVHARKSDSPFNFKHKFSKNSKSSGKRDTKSIKNYILNI
jgi:hypothetical protein